jgi:four helix bundle protein
MRPSSVLGLWSWEETLYWLELLDDANIIPPRRLAALKDETGQLTAIFVTLIKQAKRNRNSEPSD